MMNVWLDWTYFQAWGLISIPNDFIIHSSAIEWSFINISTHSYLLIKKQLLLPHFFATNLQNGIGLLEQWNNKKLIKIWVLLHQIVACLSTFQTYLTKINTFELLAFQTHHQKKLSLLQQGKQNLLKIQWGLSQVSSRWKPKTSFLQLAH
jgi:hypothetical protein